MSEKVLLTGISGWIAKHTAIELLNSGYEVLGRVKEKISKRFIHFFKFIISIKFFLIDLKN